MRLNPCFSMCVCLALLAGCKSDPNSIKDQVAILKKKDPSTKEKLKAVENLRRIASRDSVPGLCAGLKTSPPKVKQEIAVVLAELGDTAAMMPLADAIELAPTGEKAHDADAANEKIARALGDLGGKGATPQLLKLLAATTNNYTKFEVLTALGKIGDPSAGPVLSELALNDKVEAPINKKAMTALAMIAPPEALPLFVKGLFYERGTLSLYPDASFGLFRLRQGAFDAVNKLLAGKDKETLEWAKSKGITQAVVLTKAAQLAGDLRDPKSVPLLLKQLKYKDADENLALLAQVTAAEALGRMRARATVPVLSEYLKGEDDRDPYALALVRIGDKSVLPRFATCSAVGGWNARIACIQGVVALGGMGDAKIFDSLIKEEPKRFMAECKEASNGLVDCEKEKARVVEEHTKALQTYRTALETVAKCQDAKCLADALGSADPVVREKAAYAAVAKNDPEVLPALIGAVKRPCKEGGDIVARVAAVLATDWMVGNNADARARCKGEIKALQAVIETDSKVGLTTESTEEIKRLVDVIDHGREAVAAPAAAATDAAAATEEPEKEKEKAPAKPAAKPARKKGGRKGK